MNRPLLIDPSEAFLAIPGERRGLEGHKVCIALFEDLADQ